MGLDDCDLSCSGNDSVGIKLMSREEIEIRLDEVLKPKISERYNSFVSNIKNMTKYIINYLS